MSTILFPLIDTEILIHNDDRDDDPVDFDHEQ